MSTATLKPYAATKTEPETVRWYHALLLAFVGSCLIGMVECLLIITQVHNFHSRVERDAVTVTPTECLAAFGMIAGAHVLIWMPLCLCWTLLVGVARKVVPVLSKVSIVGLDVAALTLLIGVPVALTDLKTMRAGGLGGTVAAILIVVVLGGVAVLAARGTNYLRSKGWLQDYQRILALAAVGMGGWLALGLCVLPWTAFQPSSLVDTDSLPFKSNATATDDSPKNVLLIVLDTVRADHMSCYGYEKPTTPFLEELVQDATLFEQAISPSMWTVPSHASLFTGLLRRSHGADWSHTWLDDRFTTLAELAHDRGYQTGCFSNNPWVSPSTNLTQGFDTVENPGALRALHWSSARQLLMAHVVPRWTGLLSFLPWLEHDKGAGRTNRRIDAWLDGVVRRREPFFLFVNYMEAHFPYEPFYTYRRKFLTDDELTRSYSYEQSYRSTIFRPMLLSEPHAPGVLDMLKNLYDASLLQLDDAVRELFSILSHRGLLEKTMVVIVADHGEHLGEHGQLDHKYSLYQPLINIPLIVCAPAAPPQKITEPTSALEVYGWLLGAMGRKGSERVRPFNNVRLTNKYCLSELVDPCVYPLNAVFGQKAFVDTTRWIRGFYAVQKARWKLITASDGKHELFDLETDAAERNNLSDQRPEKVEELMAWLNDALQQAPRYTPVQATDEKTALSPAEIQRLRSLGYVD